MAEPTPFGSEPVQSPLGEVGMTEPEATIESEPVQESDETPLETEGAEEPEVEFTDLKTVPKEFQKIAKQMQRDYTKQMQAVAEMKRTLEQRPAVEEQPFQAPDTEEQAILDWMETGQGKALKSVFEKMVEERVSPALETTHQIRADKEVNDLIGLYGKEVLEENYDDIAAAMQVDPNIPLKYLVPSVLYSKAEERGEAKFRAKLQTKTQASGASRSVAPSSVTSATPKTIEEAFEMAKRSA